LKAEVLSVSSHRDIRAREKVERKFRRNYTSYLRMKKLVPRGSHGNQSEGLPLRACYPREGD